MSDKSVIISSGMIILSKIKFPSELNIVHHPNTKSNSFPIYVSGIDIPNSIEVKHGTVSYSDTININLSGHIEKSEY